MFPQDLEIPSPWMNAAGTLGFYPPAHWPLPEPQGIFVTNPLSCRPRTPAAERAALAYPGGLLLHSGLPNPGLQAVLRKYAGHWARSPIPIWVHLIPTNPSEADEMVRELEGVEGVAAVEVSVEANEDGAAALDILAAARGELPLVACLALSTVNQAWVKQIARLGVAAVTLSAPRGLLPNSAGKLIPGRLYSPALIPQVLASLSALRKLNLPVIAGAGVFRRQDAAALLGHGAAAVQVDTALWRGWLSD
jgi:dihydroorotate dehydrogenase (NAD+) catalytic subunit